MLGTSRFTGRAGMVSFQFAYSGMFFLFMASHVLAASSIPMALPTPVATSDQPVMIRIDTIADLIPTFNTSLTLAPGRDIPLQSTVINVNAGSGIAGNQPALDAFNRAVSTWESYLGDDVTLSIDLDMSALGAGVLGSSQTQHWRGNLGYLMGLVAAGADTGSTVEATLGYLPTSTISANVATNFSLSGSMTASQANLKALGLQVSDFPEVLPEAIITMSSEFPWDYDNSDGITPGTMDFESVALHEIGHALGFTSDVDYADVVIYLGLDDPEDAPESDFRPLDLFRFESADVPTSLDEFTDAVRMLAPGGTQYFTNGEFIYELETGRYNGSGRQASHWKDSLGIGIMDPTFAYGEIGAISEADLLALDLIGWQIAPEPATLGLLVLGGLAMLGRRRRRR